MSKEEFIIEPLGEEAIIFGKLLENSKLLDSIGIKNGDQYNLIKSAEEASELATVLLQKATKTDRVDDQEVIDEIGDVFIRLIILSKKFGVENVLQRLEHKLSKFKDYHDSERYERI